MKTQFTLALLAATCIGALTFQDKRECVDYFATNGKNENNNANFEKRCEAFVGNKAKFDAMNKKPNSKAKFGCNEFCDETQAEFELNHTGAKAPSEDEDDQSNNRQKNRRKGRRGLQSGSADLRPLYINWEKAGKVEKVKNQGSCGSCWAFTAVTVQESMQAIMHGKPTVRLSEQEGVDCVEKSGGCGGGWMSHYWNFSNSQGSMLGEDYPYQASNNACRNQQLKNSKHPGYKIASKAAQSNRVAADPLSIAQALQNGPLSIAVQADSCWGGYQGGILTESDNCYTGSNINHAVVLIGLGETDGIEHWIIRNSWGTRWGDNGNINIKVTYDGAGITNMMKWVDQLQVKDGYDPDLWNEDNEDECDIDESKNELGPGMCAFDEDCKGDRYCTDEGMCMGESGCGDDKPDDLCAINEKLNYFGPFQCQSDDECRGDRKCSQCGECKGRHMCVQ